FTQAIGRQITDGSQKYIGPEIGESLARAKRLYVESTAQGSFSVYDEKVLLEMTLYGLPFIRVKVPIPTSPPYDGSFDPPPEPIPSDVQPQLTENSNPFTRIITFTNEFDLQNVGKDMVPRVTSKVADSFLGNQQVTTLAGKDQTLIGRPVLPTLNYDITLKENPNKSGQGIAQVRGVRL